MRHRVCLPVHPHARGHHPLVHMYVFVRLGKFGVTCLAPTRCARCTRGGSWEPTDTLHQYIERSKDQVAELHKDEDVPAVPESFQMRTEL
eukprot:COSAG01_NODE_3894_length_5575_cov_746.141136_4_plen_90_part_00